MPMPPAPRYYADAAAAHYAVIFSDISMLIFAHCRFFRDYFRRCRQSFVAAFYRHRLIIA